MKIAIIGSAHPLRGGLAAFNERLAAELQQQRHEVVIYSFSLQYPSFLFQGTTQYTDEPAPGNLKILSVINSVNPLNWVKYGSRIRKENYDLVIVKYWLPFMGPCFGTILRRVKKNTRTRVACIVDNIIPHEKRPGDTAFTRYFIKPVDAFVAMSRDVLKDLTTFTSKPSVFSPHPVYNYGPPAGKEESCKKVGLDPAGRYILFFGFIRGYKGLDILLEAMNETQLKEAGIQLIVAGEYYEDRKPYENIIEKYALQDRVRLFTEFIPDSEVRYYFSAADLVVQPYRTATQSGITQIAYHFEKPMVVTNVGGLPEVVPDGKTGFVTTPEPRAIADAILHFFVPGSIPNLRENIQAEKRKYSWKTFTDVLMKTVGVK